MSIGVPPAKIRFLLEELCVELGFCLPPDAQRRLIDDPPSGVDEFTIAVIQAEGLDPRLISAQLRRAVRERVTRYYVGDES